MLATMCVAVQVTNAFSTDADGYEFATLLVQCRKEIKLVSQGVDSSFWLSHKQHYMDIFKRLKKLIF